MFHFAFFSAILKNICKQTALFCFIFISILSCKKEVDNTLNLEEEKSNEMTAILEYEIASELGEGAVWNHQSNELYWIDIEAKLLHIYNPEKKSNRTLKVPSQIGTVVPYNKYSAVVALVDGIYIIDIQSGDLKLLSDVEANMPQNRFNDGKCDPLGNLWVGSMPFDQKKPEASLYKVSEDGTTIKMRDSITISNGIAWTKDAKTMYYIDTSTGNIRAFDFDSKNATISNERIAVEISEAIGFGDGMAIDEEDMLWVGLWNGNAVARFNPKTGELLSKICVPAHNVTSCAFGGENLDELYITTALIDMTKEERKANPKSGSLFKVIPGVKGVKSQFFGKQQ